MVTRSWSNGFNFAPGDLRESEFVQVLEEKQRYGGLIEYEEAEGQEGK